MSGSNGGAGSKPRGTAAQIALRNSAIMAALHAGDKVQDIAERYELTTRQVRRVAKEFSLRPTALEKTPMEIIERVLRTYEEQLRNLAAVAHETFETMPAVALGALKARADALERYSELLSDVGKLPDNLELFRAQSYLERTAGRVIELLHEVANGRLSALEAQQEVDRLVFGAPAGEATIEGSAIELNPGEEEDPDGE